MSAAVQSPSAPGGRIDVDDGWSWPLALVSYDSRPELSAVEIDALAELMGGIRWTRSCLDDFPPDLHRLLRPVQDVLDHTEADNYTRLSALRIVTVEMHRRQRSLWGWTQVEWVETLKSRQKGFRIHDAEHAEGRQSLLALAYLLVGYCDWTELRRVERVTLAMKNIDQLKALHAQDPKSRVGYVALSQALVSLGLLQESLARWPQRGQRQPPVATDGVPAAWAKCCARWYATSTLRATSRDGYYVLLLKAGRWLAAAEPEITCPEEWTRSTAAAYVAAIDRLVIGQWVLPNIRHAGRLGQPLTAASKVGHLTAMRAFFRDCQEWGWIPRRFDPGRVFSTPRSARALITPNPRVVADDVWAKLVWAGLNLTDDDLVGRAGAPIRQYPTELVRAVAAVWLFTGLRNDELRRLPVGCVRWQSSGGENGPICLLDVPVNKTGAGFTKPVDRLVGEAIARWGAVRPQQEPLPDPTTGAPTHYLFAHRNRRLGELYLNETLIPILCRKGGVPDTDARGAITSHRARATIATQLYNAKEPMTLFELQAWLGHRSPESTQYYAKLTPTTLTRAYADADYFTRNVRTISVLLDQDALREGAAARGEAWKLYDLGHGYCSYDFFDLSPSHGLREVRLLRPQGVRPRPGARGQGQPAAATPGDSPHRRRARGGRGWRHGF